MSDAQLAELYPTVQSYVDKVVAKTLDNAAAGYIPKDFTRDPAWYTDIRDPINDKPRGSTAASPPDAGRRAYAPRTTARRVTSTRAISILDLSRRPGLAVAYMANAAARDAVLRPTRAASALLWKTIDAPTSTDSQATVGGSVPATLSLSLGAPASFGAFTPGVTKEYTATSRRHRDQQRRRRDAHRSPSRVT